MTLEIKNLAPYLPYGLEGIATFLEDTIFIVDTLNTRRLRVIGETKFGNNVPLGCFINEFKPILRPLSDLSKEILHNGEIVNVQKEIDFIQYGVDVYQYTDGDIGLNIETANYSQQVDLLDGYRIAEILLKYHFDIFGLIPQGLAIDINTLNK